jgi:uncharacterized repeat protein (TIGR03803 family)
MLPALAQAQFTTVHSFNNKGQQSWDGLVQRGNNLYGVTSAGGAGFGTVFKIPLGGGTEVTIHSFSGPDGSNPRSKLTIGGPGTFYGTTAGGGANGHGTVFKIVNGTHSVLHSFNQTDGKSPVGGLLYSGGFLYGTTNVGGTNFGGTIFKMDLSGNILWSYSPPVTVGYQPFSGVMKIGNWLYGTTALGGGAANRGSVFRIKLDGSNYQVLYAFAGGPDGAQPNAGLVSFNGSLFGTTPLGGAYGYGTVYRIDANGSNYSLVYSFPGGSDGIYPQPKLLPVTTATGGSALYGNTEAGGGSGPGTLFKITAAGVLTTLYQFSGGVDGKIPVAELIQATDGKLYSTTFYGGTYGFGTIYSFVP